MTVTLLNVVAHLAATLILVLIVGYSINRILRLVGQPSVIGEILAGIILGPSLVGTLCPRTMDWLLKGSDGQLGESVFLSLKSIADLGAVAYMFIVGLELDGSQFRLRFRSAFGIALTGIAVPFLLGAGLAMLIPERASHDVSGVTFALFMGIAMSITAFPVLARILADRIMEKTELGILALCCAAIADALAWGLLAIILGAEVRTHSSISMGEGIVYYLGSMVLIARPLIRRLAQWRESKGYSAIALALLGLALWISASATDGIGLHAVFGAFLLGVLVPADSRLAQDFIRLARWPANAILLPAFFALSGLNTRIDLVSGWNDWSLCMAIIAVAVIGKMGGTVLAAKMTGSNWRNATALGVLMNTRGLMELIVLNIGLNLGIISPTIYAMMVVMALVTTMATSPLLSLVMLAPTKN